MVGSMRSSDSSSGNAGGGLNSAGNRASGAGPGASSNRSTTGNGFGGTNSSGGGLNSAGNRATGAGPGASANRSTSSSGATSASTAGGQVGGGLNSAGNRATGAGPGASSNRSTSSGGGQVGGGLNSAGNRASGAGPGASANRSTTGNGFGGTGTGTGFGGQNSPAGMSNSSLAGGMVSDSSRRADMAQAARASENASMNSYNAARAVSQESDRRASLAQQARAAETQSMNDMADWGKEVKSVISAGPGFTTVELNNGQIETRKGDRASRNNNPGNIEAGAFANKLGAVGTDGRFAVFANKEDGFNAIGALLSTQRYANKTVEGAISSYAPPNENNTASYAATVAAKIGVTKDTPMSSLTAAQRTAMAKAITSVEGNTGYTTQTTGVDRFASTYMGSKASTSTPSTSSQPSSPSFGGMNSPRGVASTTASAPAPSTQQNDPSGLPPGTYQGYDPSGLPPASRPASRPTATPSLPASAPVPAAKPAQEPTLGQKLAATAIDVGLGMLPGIGTVASVVNGGLALTGNATLGERAVASITGDGPGAAGSDPNARGFSGNSRGGVVETTVPEQNDESFEDRYMKFVDPTPRPTPAERWNYNTAGYA